MNELLWCLKCNINSLPYNKVGFNDIYINDGGYLEVVTGIEALIQLVKQALWTWYGEYDFDTTIGVTYNRIFTEFPDMSLVQYQIQNAIYSVNDGMNEEQLKVYGITQVLVTDFRIINDSRSLIVATNITLKSSETIQVKI